MVTAEEVRAAVGAWTVPRLLRRNATVHGDRPAPTDPDGLLRIADRRKEIVITASGKNIAPSKVESLLRAHPLVGYAVVVGDRVRT